MQNDMRGRLIAIIRQSRCVDVWDYWNDDFKKPNPVETLADHIIKNGVVPVVRCKDCKYLIFSDCYGECSKGYIGIVSPNDYCSRGERG